jgi:transposase
MESTNREVAYVGVGIDTARYGHHVTFLKPDRQPAAASMQFEESGDGYKRFQERLGQLHRKYPAAELRIHIDAAGQYATNLEHNVRTLDLPITVSVGEPKRNKDYRQAVFPKRKADATESHAMARFAVAEQPVATIGVSEEIYALREIAGRLESQVKTTTQTVNRLHNLLARVFPELGRIAPAMSAQWVLTLLKKYPTPARIAAAQMSSLKAIPHLQEAKAAKIQAAAKTTVASFQGHFAESLVQQAVEQVQHSQLLEKQLEKLLLGAFDTLPRSGHFQVSTIPGIGAVTAAVLVAKIVSVDRFATAEKLVGYFGVFPEEQSSGVDRQGRPQIHTRHMSHKGNDLVRRYLFCAAKSAITHNPAVRALYKRLRARGTRGDVALGHAMRKLLHLVFAVWTTDQPFDENHHPWETIEGEHQSTAATHEDESTQEAAGHKREVLPARKVVTAAKTNLDSRQAPVKESRSSCPTGSIDFAYVREQITIEQVLRQLGHWDSLKGRGPQRRGPCPIHRSQRVRSRSFSVNLDKNVFQCLSSDCGAHGNALDLWGAVKGQKIYDAAISLAETLGIELQRNNREAGTRNSKSKKTKAKQKGVITPDAT